MRPYKLLFLLLLPLLFLSCTMPSYVFTEPKQVDVDFTEGKWLLKTTGQDYINEKAVKDFTGFLGSRLSETTTTSGLLLVKDIPLQPNKQLLTDLYNGTGYDFFINIKDNVYKNDISAIELGKSHYDSQSSVGVTLEVYDLKNKTILYSQTVVGSTERKSTTSGDVNFYKPAASLVLGSYNRLIKDLRSKSVLE